MDWLLSLLNNKVRKKNYFCPVTIFFFFFFLTQGKDKNWPWWVINNLYFFVFMMQSEKSRRGASVKSPRIHYATLSTGDTYSNLTRRCLNLWGPSPKHLSKNPDIDWQSEDFVRSYVGMSFCYAFPTWIVRFVFSVLAVGVEETWTALWLLSWRGFHIRIKVSKNKLINICS